MERINNQLSWQKKYKDRSNFKLFINMYYIILFNILYNRNNAKANILNNAYININKSDSNHEGKIIDIFHKIQEYFVNNENGILTIDIRFFKKTDSPKISKSEFPCLFPLHWKIIEKQALWHKYKTIIILI